MFVPQRLDANLVDITGKPVMQPENTPFIPPSIEELSKNLMFEPDQAKVRAADIRIFVERKSDVDVLKSTTHPTLRSLCRNRRLDPTGKKAVLLARIVSDPSIAADNGPLN